MLETVFLGRTEIWLLLILVIFEIVDQGSREPLVSKLLA